MFSAYSPLTRMLSCAGEVRGRKKLQKMVFIAQSLGYPFAEPFHLHVWGPYSEVLAVKLKEMTEWGFAREEALPGPAGNSTYVYTPGPNAHRVIADEMPGLDELVDCLNAQDATFLEGVATALYLQSQGQTPEQVSAALVRLKPDKFPDEGRVVPVLQFAESLSPYRAH